MVVWILTVDTYLQSVHPRVCGERPLKQNSWRLISARRFIPAYAGNAETSRLVQLPSVRRFIPAYAGNAIAYWKTHVELVIRFIPAYAGNALTGCY